MTGTIDIYEPTEEFLTRGTSSWAENAPLRVWQVNEHGTPVEVTKENK